MFRSHLGRLLTLVLLPVVLMLSGMQFAQAEGAQPYVNVSAASCVDGTGLVSVTLYAGSGATKDVQFIVMVDNVSYGSDVFIPVPPGGQSQPIQVTPLEDGSHRFEIIADDVTIFDSTRDVSCVSPPTGPYSNPKGSLWEPCGQKGVQMNASNFPIGNNLEDLQAATFTVTFVSNVVGGVQQLDSFTLPSKGQDDAFDYSHFYSLPTPGVVSLYADGVAIQHLDYSGACVVVPDVVHHHKHKKHHHKHHKHHASLLPNTGK